MPSNFSQALLGIIAAILGAGLLLIAMSYPTTFCFSGTGIETTCTTSTKRQLTTAFILITGVGSLGVGGFTIWKTW